METLRSLKEAAEKPEKEAKDIHQKAWEGECTSTIRGDFMALKASVSDNSLVFKAEELVVLQMLLNYSFQNP